MKAAVFRGSKSIAVEEVPKPMITAPKDAIVHITHTTICGSDLHIYNGELNQAMKKGDIMGHEAIGIVDQVGPEVKSLQPGDRVIILPVIACGECFYCKRKEYSLCDKTNPSKEIEKMYGHRLSGIFGYSHLTGGYPGDQAEWCRVPNADLTCVKAPHDMDPKKLVGLADVTTTAWHGCELAEVMEGDIVGVWGCGAVGLSIQRLSKLRGAKRVYAMDVDLKRLEIAKEFGMIPVDVSKHEDVAEYILSVEPMGLDRSIEASGFRSAQSLAHKGMRALRLEGDSGDTVSDCIKATRKGGNVALIGDFFFSTNKFPIGMLMEKTITLRGGQLMAQKYYPFLLNMVIDGKYDPSWMFTHEAKLEDIDKWYGFFDRHTVPGGLKVLLTTAFGRSQN
ncbi:alcohol dehydrogenase GroES-like domain-containing protein [Colletotrichum graminicola]|uniref:Alcohol dehydrogenase GroES-like domain-containing protein n=1 Tax=Colletotrichum graminicola (strain M1.001 / M2 / FGSC 10212) TaxID=645133 RepID=E3QFM8_COLGM|nr:alcohol dehydrogenase GroES-like domain-containing protein [Colletotrichum graminicola M1.001]EFQ29666.1 alcohol dehydrogenase GroES-like domain-containing protein [Colletotrichum graminicola M1.001]WDK23666.1 alcohol dehydrogenase GroES-like domain-containing protein [Colletotrichum graminicola]